MATPLKANAGFGLPGSRGLTDPWISAAAGLSGGGAPLARAEARSSANDTHLSGRDLRRPL